MNTINYHHKNLKSGKITRINQNKIIQKSSKFSNSFCGIQEVSDPIFDREKDSCIIHQTQKEGLDEEGNRVCH